MSSPSSRSRFSQLLSYYRPYLGLLVHVMACALVVAAITLALPLIVRDIAKSVLEEGAPDALAGIYRAAGLMLALVAIGAACRFYVDYRGHAMGAMMEADLRRALFAHYQKLSFSFFDGQKTGQLMSRITNDLLSLAELFHHAPEDILIYSLRFFGAFAVLLTIDVRLTVAVFALLPFMAAYALYVGQRMRVAVRKNWERIGEVNALVEQNLSGIRIVKAFGNEDLEREKFAHGNDRFLGSRKDIYRNEAYLSLGIDAFSGLTTVAILAFGGVSFSRGALDLADLITYLLYIGNLTEPIRALVHTAGQYQQGIAGFERFAEVMAVAPERDDAPDARDLPHVRGHVAFRDVSFRYGPRDEYVLKNVSLDVPAGECVALVGSSGVGKTTLCSLIPRFYEASEGQVLLDGVDIKNVRLRALRRCVGVVEQDVYLFAGTVLDNIRYGCPGASLEEVIAAAKRANAHEFITQLPDGYDTEIGQRGVRLSGGQRQRLGIARVFVKDPPVVILDEATSALDRESEHAVQESLEALATDRTTFVIAHRLSTIRRAGRIVVLAECGIVEQGTHAELLERNGAYARMCRMQFADISVGDGASLLGPGDPS